MEQREKLDAAIDELQNLGVGAFTAAPPLFRLLWRVGVSVPPPLFLPFGRLALGFGAFFAVGWLPLQWLIRGGQLLDRLVVEVTISIVVGAAFGIILAAYYRYRARSLRLPSWAEFLANTSR